ncbi:MAG: hypothetical protein ACO1QS_16135 [Verrucomicrobiota bacterium]
MKLEVVLSLLLLMMADVSGATPLASQWRLPLPQAAGEKSQVLCSAHDNAGNLLVGLSLTRSSGPGAGVVSKLSPLGVELWRFELPDFTLVYIGNIGVDADGNVYFTTGTAVVGSPTGQKVLLVKLSPDGQELWRCPLVDHPTPNPGYPFRISPTGTVWMSFLTTTQSSTQVIQVRRISSAGTVDWSVELPWRIESAHSNFRPDEIMDVDASENVYLTGSLPHTHDPYSTSLLCKINANGQPAWTNQIPAKHTGDVKVAADGKICVSGLGGYTVFNANGTMAGTSGVAGDYYIVKDALADGRFLLHRFGTAGEFLLLTGSDLQPVWQTALGLDYPIQLARNPAGGWLSAGYRVEPESTTSQFRLFVQAIAEDGSRRWQQELPGVLSFRFSANGNFNLLMEVTEDGLLLAGNQSEVFNQSAVIAAGFSRQALQPPSVIAAPLVDGVWPKGQPYTLTVTPRGEGPFSYQWYHRGQPLLDQTAQTLSLAPSTFPSARGYYHVEVTSGDQTTASPVAEVKLDGIYMESLGLTSYGYSKVRAMSNIGSRFTLQWSTDLINWSSYSSTTNISEYSFEAIPSGTSRFFRAIKVE